MKIYRRKNTYTQTWHVIVNSENMILGIYGAAIKHVAEEQLREIHASPETCFLKTEIKTIQTNSRPSIGAFI